MSNNKRRRDDLLSHWGSGRQQVEPKSAPPSNTPSAAVAPSETLPTETLAAIQAAVEEVMGQRGDVVARALLSGKRGLSPYKRRKRAYDKRRTRRTYEVTSSLVEAIGILSQRWQCPPSDVVVRLVGLALVAGLERIEPDKVQSSQQQLRYPYRLVPPPLEEWLVTTSESEKASEEDPGAEAADLGSEGADEGIVWPDLADRSRYLTEGGK